jgi:hypothetical protein
MQVVATCKVHWRGNIVDIWDGEGELNRCLRTVYGGEGGTVQRGDSVNVRAREVLNTSEWLREIKYNQELFTQGNAVQVGNCAFKLWAAEFWLER